MVVAVLTHPKCLVLLQNPKDYLLVTPTETTWKTGCSDRDNAQVMMLLEAHGMSASFEAAHTCKLLSASWQQYKP